MRRTATLRNGLVATPKCAAQCVVTDTVAAIHSYVPFIESALAWGHATQAKEQTPVLAAAFCALEASLPGGHLRSEA
jgi:hypothetical protein